MTFETKKNVHCIGFWPDYEKYFFEDRDIQNYNAMIFNPRERMNYNIFKFMMSRDRIRKSIVKYTLDYIEKNKNDIVIVQYKDFLVEPILKIDSNINLSINLRNPVSADAKTIDMIRKAQNRGFKVLSFDHDDCQKYGLLEYKQFVRKDNNIKDLEPAHDFVFMGVNKGRAETVNTIAGKLRDRGFSANLEILEPGSASKSSKTIPYVDYVKFSISGRCIIEILQENQVGLTLRPLEAIVYKRKLLTNNASIRSEAFFHPNNIFIIDKDLDLTGIETFMSLPLHEIDPGIMRLYSAEALFDICAQNSAKKKTL